VQEAKSCSLLEQLLIQIPPKTQGLI